MASTEPGEGAGWAGDGARELTILPLTQYIFSGHTALQGAANIAMNKAVQTPAMVEHTF